MEFGYSESTQFSLLTFYWSIIVDLYFLSQSTSTSAAHYEAVKAAEYLSFLCVVDIIDFSDPCGENPSWCNLHVRSCLTHLSEFD